MSEAVVDDIVAVLPPLLQSLEGAGLYRFAISIRRISLPSWRPPARRTRRCRPSVYGLADWPGQFADVKTSLEVASDAALAAFSGLRAVQHGNGDMIAVFPRAAVTPRARRRRCIRSPPNCRRSAISLSILPCAKMPI